MGWVKEDWTIPKSYSGPWRETSHMAVEIQGKLVTVMAAESADKIILLVGGYDVYEIDKRTGESLCKGLRRDNDGNIVTKAYDR